MVIDNIFERGEDVIPQCLLEKQYYRDNVIPRCGSPIDCCFKERIGENKKYSICLYDYYIPKDKK